MDRVNPGADAALAGYARMLLDALPDGREQSLPDIVRQLVQVLLPMGKASIANVAQLTGKSVRTLQRELDASGVIFRQLVSDARHTLCMGHLRDPRVSVTRIAEMLGYASPPAFIRWFHGRFGVSPQRWRRSQARESLTAVYDTG
jgi:AraC-like DNA-binding protein